MARSKSIKKNIQINSASKTAVFLLVGLLFIFGGSIVVLGWYYGGFFDAGSLAEEINQQKAQENLKADYNHDYESLISSYLSRDGLVDDDFLNQTRQTKNSLINMVVPADKLDLHLSSVLILDQIELAAIEGDQTNVDLNLQKLSELK